MQTLTLREHFKLQRFTRGLGPEPGPVQLDRSRIFILPTATGLLFAGVLLIMLLGAITYNNSMGHLFTFLAGSMALVSILHSYRNLAQLRFTSGRATPVFAGERAGFEILATNPGRLPRFGIQLQPRGEPAVSIDLAAQQTARVTLQRSTTRRGVLPLGHCTVSTRYPLGLFRAWAYLELQADCLVYPRPGPERPLPQSLAYKPHESGYKGRGVADFVGFRAYRPGDSPRHVFWKAVAREQALLVKQFGGDRADEVWLDWQALAGMDTEQRLSQLCRWVLEADRNQQSYGLRLPGIEIAIAGGNAHKHRCLETLARFG
ncbi:MAG: DUF58 domain-containing protein [Gammaproteobacteria bacterium]|jgi:uncharacterized protein (DUF58 family)|nr:DUF58 domain-containing protein [Gammaproteobacteria bacterium]